MNRRILFISIGLVLLIALSLLAQEVGGISLRSVGRGDTTLEFSLAQPVIPGVPTTLHIESLVRPDLEVEWRTSDTTVFLKSVKSGEASIPIILPCSTNQKGALVLRRLEDNAVLAQQKVDVLPPGVDCAFSVSQ